MIWWNSFMLHGKGNDMYDKATGVLITCHAVLIYEVLFTLHAVLF